MSDIGLLFSTDWGVVLFGIFVLLFSIVVLIVKIEYLKKYFGIKTKWDLEHELLVNTASELNELKQAYTNDIEKIKSFDTKIGEELKTFTEELHKALDGICVQVEAYRQSYTEDIQANAKEHKKVADKIQTLIDDGREHDDRINAVCHGVMELLGDKIDTSFSRYIALNGIPENEVEDFDAIFIAYERLNGNGKRREKYRYTKQHLPVIPVDIKLIDENVDT